MKKTIGMTALLFLMMGLIGCNGETANIDFPFEVGDIENIEMYHYESRSRGYEVTKEKQERYKREETYMISKWDKALNNDKYFSKNNF